MTFWHTHNPDHPSTTHGRSYGTLLLLLLVFTLSSPNQAHAETTAPQAKAPQPNALEIKAKETNGQTETVDPATTSPMVEKLSLIQQAIDAKRSTMRDLNTRLKKVDDLTEKLEIEQQLDRYRGEIATLQQSFNQIALKGITPDALAEQPDLQINWENEFKQISLPLLSTLKEITEKPRQVDSLRREIDRKQSQLRLIERALESLASLRAKTLPAETSKLIDQLETDWQQRKTETARALDLAQYKLNSLESEGTDWLSSASESMTSFLKGRGLTLLLALVAALIVWLAARAGLMLYTRMRKISNRESRYRQAPLVLYSYRILVAFLIVLAVLMVFYARGDLLLLTLAVIVLIGIALSLRQTLPRYAAELRLLLGVGPVRERERIMFDGIPLRVESLSIYAVLHNPLLDGIVRVPLHEMNTHISRPASKESWFPSSKDDYVVLDDGSYGKVLRQTVELVELMILDSRVQLSTQRYLEKVVRNLTLEGFGIAAKFGIDYQHQAICLDTVSTLLREGIVAHFDNAGMKADIRDILVEFSDAGSSSLDYRIYMILDGRAANAFYRVQRMVQQACVQVCNEQGWVIPFTQVTVHHAADTSGNS